jgi:hypothetical protein
VEDSPARVEAEAVHCGPGVAEGCRTDWPTARHSSRWAWVEKAIALQGDEGEVVVELELAPRSKVQTPHGKEGLP